MQWMQLQTIDLSCHHIQNLRHWQPQHHRHQHPQHHDHHSPTALHLRLISASLQWMLHEIMHNAQCTMHNAQCVCTLIYTQHTLNGTLNTLNYTHVSCMTDFLRIKECKCLATTEFPYMREFFSTCTACDKFDVCTLLLLLHSNHTLIGFHLLLSPLLLSLSVNPTTND